MNNQIAVKQLADKVAQKLRQEIEECNIHIKQTEEHTYIHMHAFDRDAIMLYQIAEMQEILHGFRLDAHAVKTCTLHDSICVSVKVVIRE